MVRSLGVKERRRDAEPEGEGKEEEEDWVEVEAMAKGKGRGARADKKDGMKDRGRCSALEVLKLDTKSREAAAMSSPDLSRV